MKGSQSNTQRHRWGVRGNSAFPPSLTRKQPCRRKKTGEWRKSGPIFGASEREIISTNKETLSTCGRHFAAEVPNEERRRRRRRRRELRNCLMRARSARMSKAKDKDVRTMRVNGTSRLSCRTILYFNYCADVERIP